MTPKVGRGRLLSADFSPDSHSWVLEALTKHIPAAQVQAALERANRCSRRIRDIPADAAVWLMIAMGLWGDLDIPSLWRQVAGTHRVLVQASAGIKPPCKSALSQARLRLGARPLRSLFKAIMSGSPPQPAKGAIYKGMRMLAIDGDDHRIPDTPCNVKAFGKAATTRFGQKVLSAYPQIHILEYTFDDPGRPGHGERHRLITLLTNAQRFPIKELIVLYHQRWEIERDNDQITTHQLARPVELPSRTPAGVVQETYAIYLAHNAIRALMQQAAQTINVDPRTLSFINAVRVIREAIAPLRTAPTVQLPILYRGLMTQIAAGRLPPRDGRIHPGTHTAPKQFSGRLPPRDGRIHSRVVKVKMSKFPKKRTRHYQWPQPTKKLPHAIVLLN